MKLDHVQVITDIFAKQLLIQATFSNPRDKSMWPPNKVIIRPIHIKGELVYQLSEQRGEKIFHRNLSSKDCQETIFEEFIPIYKQAIFLTTEKDYHLLVSKTGEKTILAKEPTKKEAPLTHNRQKNYILAEGVPLPILIELGLMNREGRIHADKRDKFIQINRFLEMVSDTLSVFKEGQSLHIVDFGCGKAYLTFALYYFLQKVKGFTVQMTGLDKKEDVIASCSSLAKKLGYDSLQFKVADISSYSPDSAIDMMVALHACNTATDSALYQAVRWQSKVILAAPCCQHELFKQIECPSLDALLQYGILKERFAALATDAARAALLEMQGYSTQVIEFIDSEHTPKNLLIRAVFGNSQESRDLAKKNFITLKETLNIEPTLEVLLKN